MELQLIIENTALPVLAIVVWNMMPASESCNDGFVADFVSRRSNHKSLEGSR